MVTTIARDIIGSRREEKKKESEREKEREKESISLDCCPIG